MCLSFDWNDLHVGREFDCKFLKTVKSPPYALPPPPHRHYIDRCIILNKINNNCNEERITNSIYVVVDVFIDMVSAITNSLRKERQTYRNEELHFKNAESGTSLCCSE